MEDISFILFSATRLGMAFFFFLYTNSVLCDVVWQEMDNRSGEQWFRYDHSECDMGEEGE